MRLFRGVTDAEFSVPLKVGRDTSRLAKTCQTRTRAETLSLGRRDTSLLRIPRSRHTPEEVTLSLEHLDTSHQVLLQAGIRIRPRGLTDTNHLLPDSRLHRPALPRQPQARVMSSLTWVKAVGASWNRLIVFEFRKHRLPSNNVIFPQCGLS